MNRTLPAILAMALATSVTACRKPATAQASAAQPPAAQPAEAPQPAKPVPAQLPDVLAKVNGEPVTKVELERLIKNMEMGAGQSVPPERRDEVYRGALDQLVTYTVLTQETKARNISVTEAEIDGRLQQMKGQFPDEQAFKKALAERGLTIEKLREDARNDMVIQKMMQAEVATHPAPNDAQIREFYDKNPEKFAQPESLRASHILVKVDEKADDATRQKARAKAEALLTQAKGGADFAQLARENSGDSSAAQGGDLGFFRRGQMVPAFDQAAFALKPGELSGVVPTQFGYHIIKAGERKPASTVPFEEVSPRIREFLTEQQKQQRAEAFVEALKKKARIEVLI